MLAHHRRQMGQAALAEKVGATQTMVSRFEHGQSVPDVFLARSLAVALGLPPDGLQTATERVLERAERTTRAWCGAPHADLPWWAQAQRVAGRGGVEGILLFVVAVIEHERSLATGRIAPTAP